LDEPFDTARTVTGDELIQPGAGQVPAPHEQQITEIQKKIEECNHGIFIGFWGSKQCRINCIFPIMNILFFICLNFSYLQNAK